MTLPDEMPGQSTLDTNLSYRISILHSLLGKLTTAIYASRGLTSHQWKVMSILYNWPPMPAVRITSMVTLDKAAISRGVAGLLDLKLARRYLDNESGMIYITLTEPGRTMYRAMASELAHLQRDLFGEVRDAEQRSFFAILNKIEHALREATGAGALEPAGPATRKKRTLASTKKAAPKRSLRQRKDKSQVR
jgi:DNA-binding MarR family transcriptional regulator